MSRKTTLQLLAVSGLVALVAGTAAAQQGRAYAPPKNAFGQPDFTGVWTNSTLTPLERAASYGEQLVLTEAEVRALEGERLEARAAGDAPTDPSLLTEDLPFDCGGGFTGVNCGYNSGWTDSGDQIMRVGGQPRTSFITTTANGRIPPRRPAPATAAGAGRGGVAALPGRGGGRRGDNPENLSLGERCLTSFGNSAGPVMLPLLYNNTYLFQQGKDAVAIWVEMVHDVRIVRLNAEHRNDGVRPWWGDSVGRYEGDTLVVETINYHPRNAFRGASDDLKVTERFTRTGPTSLHYQFMVEAPSVWEEPWGGEYEFSPSQGIYEYACHEGNYSMEGMLAGARQEDQEAAAAAANAN